MPAAGFSPLFRHAASAIATPFERALSMPLILIRPPEGWPAIFASAFRHCRAFREIFADIFDIFAIIISHTSFSDYAAAITPSASR
jgi:hypothetical protein